MSKLSRTEIHERVMALSLEDLVSLVESVTDALYGAESNNDWSADELDTIARVLHDHNLTSEA